MGARKQNNQQGQGQIVPPITGGTQQYSPQQGYQAPNPYGVQYIDYTQPQGNSLINSLAGTANTGNIPTYTPPTVMSGPLQAPPGQPPLPFTGYQSSPFNKQKLVQGVKQWIQNTGKRNPQRPIPSNQLPGVRQPSTRMYVDERTGKKTSYGY